MKINLKRMFLAVAVSTSHYLPDWYFCMAADAKEARQLANAHFWARAWRGSIDLLDLSMVQQYLIENISSQADCHLARTDYERFECSLPST